MTAVAPHLDSPAARTAPAGRLRSGARVRADGRRRVTAKVAGIAGRVALWLAAAVVVAVAGAMHLGLLSFIVVSGTSMEPGLHTGDLVVMVRADTYREGDVAAYRIPAGQAGEGHRVIHRIVGSDDTGYILQGDNRTTTDVYRPTDGDMVGRQVLTVGQGYVWMRRIASPLGLAVFLGAVVTWLLWPSSDDDTTTDDDGDDGATEANSGGGSDETDADETDTTATTIVDTADLDAPSTAPDEPTSAEPLSEPVAG